MGGQGSGRKPDIVKKMLADNQPYQHAPQDSFALPNLSGDHSRGKVLTTPSNPTDIPNKAYVDASGGGSGHTIQDETVDLTARTNLNFTGAGVAATDNAGNDATDVTITADVITDGSQTLTNKTIDLTDNTVTGTTAEFNTANSDQDFATIAGTETLTSKTLTTPVLGGTPSADGEVGFDSTQEAVNYFGNGKLGTVPKIVATGVGTETFTNDTASDQDFATMYTFPANSIYTGKIFRISIANEFIAGTSSVTATPYMKLGSTKVVQGPATNLPNARTRSGMFVVYVIARAAAGASAAVTCMPVANPNFDGNRTNEINEPVTLATNGTLTVNFGVTFSATGSTESVEQQAFIIEELN